MLSRWEGREGEGGGGLAERRWFFDEKSFSTSTDLNLKRKVK